MTPSRALGHVFHSISSAASNEPTTRDSKRLVGPTKSSRSSMSSAEQIEAYLDRMFGHRPGAVVLAFGTGGHLNERSKYRARNWSECSFRWPDERRQLIDDALRSRIRSDVYVLVTLRFGPKPARKGSCQGSEYCWADLDRASDDTPGRLANLLSEGSFLVRSGQPGHLHVYIKLDAIYPAEVIERLNKGLMHYLKADRKWAENTVLRLPGTRNHKGRAAGGKSYRVVFEDVPDRTHAPWGPTKLIDLLGPLPEPQKSNSQGQGLEGPKKVRKQTSRSRAEIVPVDPEPISDDRREHIVQQLTDWNQVPRRGADHSRSGQLYWLVAGIMELGHSDGVIMAVVQNYGPARAKWDDEDLLRRDIQRCINKLRTHHSHIGQTCEQANCRGGTNDNLAAEIGDIRSHFEANYRSNTGSTDSKVFNALLQRATEIGRLDVGVSVRKLCELASIGSPNTLTASLGRLTQAGYVKKVLLADGKPMRRGKGPAQSRAHCYKVIVPAHETDGQNSLAGHTEVHSDVDNSDTLNHNEDFVGGGRGNAREYPRVIPNPRNRDPQRDGGTRNAHVVSDAECLLRPQLDMWRLKGLGSTYETYHELSLGPSTVKVIAEASHRDQRTIRRHLRKLEHHGLAQRVSGNQWAALYRDPNEVAEDLGTSGMGEKQAAQHAIESQQFGLQLKAIEDEQRKQDQELEDLAYTRRRGILAQWKEPSKPKK